MKKKARPKQSRRSAADLLEVNGVLASPDKGQFQYIKPPVMIALKVSEERISFEVSYFNKKEENWGVTFRHDIKGPEAMRGFVDFIREASALNADLDHEIIEPKKVPHMLFDIKYGMLMYTVRPIWFRLILSDDEVKLNFTFVDKVFDHWGLTLDYQIEGKKQTQSFVDFILRAYEVIKRKKK